SAAVCAVECAARSSVERRPAAHGLGMKAANVGRRRRERPSGVLKVRTPASRCIRNWGGAMSIQKLLVAAVAFAFVGCSSTGPARSSGSLAISNDQQYIYAVDTDSNAVFVMDAKSLEVVTSVKVGNRPYRVVVGSDDTLYVANRGSRSVSVIHKGDWKEATTLATGIDPNGMQISADGKTL